MGYLKTMKLLLKNSYEILKGGGTMMAMLIALNIIDGDFTFAKVPNKLKDAVRKQLIKLGHEELAK